MSSARGGKPPSSPQIFFFPQLPFVYMFFSGFKDYPTEAFPQKIFYYFWPRAPKIKGIFFKKQGGHQGFSLEPLKNGKLIFKLMGAQMGFFWREF